MHFRCCLRQPAFSFYLFFFFLIWFKLFSNNLNASNCDTLLESSRNWNNWFKNNFNSKWTHTLLINFHWTTSKKNMLVRKSTTEYTVDFYRNLIRRIAAIEIGEWKKRALDVVFKLYTNRLIFNSTLLLLIETGKCSSRHTQTKSMNEHTVNIWYFPWKI